MNKARSIAIFGGSGYIGSFLIRELIKKSKIGKIYILDIKEPRKEIWNKELIEKEKNGKILYQYCDVRNEINLEENIEYIYNLAAIHREPGHQPIEYFETNIRGAENITKYASKIGCNKLLFTSSIAPYGSAEIERTEKSLTVPYSPYGSSKLVAEKIHEIWLEKESRNKLIIVRPGVIFGPWEDGNVPRMMRALNKNLFFYTGNKKTRKAGGYVKELISSMLWIDENIKDRKILYNFSFEEPPTIEEYVNAITRALGKGSNVYDVPYSVIYSASLIINLIANILKIKNPAHPERIKKLKINNLIKPNYLIERGYKYNYTLESALNDWKKENPIEWK